MRYPVRFPLRMLVAATVAAGLAAAQPVAAQCSGYECQRVAPGCRQCVYVPGSNADCISYGECGCADAQCFAAPRNAQEALRRDTGIVPRAPAAELCSVPQGAEASAPLPFFLAARS